MLEAMRAYCVSGRQGFFFFFFLVHLFCLTERDSRVAQMKLLSLDQTVGLPPVQAVHIPETRMANLFRSTGLSFFVIAVRELGDPVRGFRYGSIVVPLSFSSPSSPFSRTLFEAWVNSDATCLRR